VPIVQPTRMAKALRYMLISRPHLVSDAGREIVMTARGLYTAHPTSFVTMSPLLHLGWPAIARSSLILV
jgi:hypothetical protein